MYDVTRKDTFAGLESWLNELDTYTTKSNTVKMLVGNKTDKVSLEMHLLTLFHRLLSLDIEYKCEISAETNPSVVKEGDVLCHLRTRGWADATYYLIFEADLIQDFNGNSPRGMQLLRERFSEDSERFCPKNCCMPLKSTAVQQHNRCLRFDQAVGKN